MITLMRHGESEWNANINKIENDSILTQNGINLAKNISGIYDIVICSSQRRTLQTLEASNIKYTILYKTDLCDENYTNNAPIDEFNNYIKILNPIKNKILVISHANFIKQYCKLDKKILNLEQNIKKIE